MASMKLVRCPVASPSPQLKRSAYVRKPMSTSPLGPRAADGVITGRGGLKIARAMDSGASLKGMQSLFKGGKRRNCQMKASHAGTENTESSERLLWQSKIKDLSRNSAVAAARKFPWEKVCGRFIQRVVDLVCMVVKWLAMPVLALSAVSEIVYTLTAKKDIFIPLGVLMGVLLAKIVGNASLDVAKELQDGRASWPLIALGMFFVLLKLPGPYYPSWAAAFLPHVANAGLVQTALLLRNARLVFV